MKTAVSTFPLSFSVFLVVACSFAICWQLSGTYGVQRGAASSSLSALIR